MKYYDAVKLLLLFFNTLVFNTFLIHHVTSALSPYKLRQNLDLLVGKPLWKKIKISYQFQYTS